jgi:hypothetical protein
MRNIIESHNKLPYRKITKRNAAMPRKNAVTIEQYNGQPTNLGYQPMRLDILDALYNFLSGVVDSRHKTLFIRFDLRFPAWWTQPSEGAIERFSDSFVKNRRRNGYDPALFWVRERNQQDGRVHFHCILLLDGQRTMRAWEHLLEAQRFWGNALGLPPEQHVGLVHLAVGGQQTADGVMLRHDDPGLSAKLEDCFHRISYLAKAEGKEQLPLNARAFGHTRVAAASEDVRSTFMSPSHQPPC